MNHWILLIATALTSHAYFASAQEVPCPRTCRSCSGGVADCSGQHLTAPPREYPNGTKELNLGNNYIRAVGSRTFNELASLEVLKISSNHIRSLLNDAFVKFPGLMSLEVTDNRIARISRRAFRNLNNLRTLSLNQNKIRTLHAGRIFENLPALYQLNLANNKIRSIGENDFSNVKNIHYLDLRNNKITSIHRRAFKELASLRYLFLPNNPITSLPNMVWGTTALQLLDMSHCELESVPGPLPPSLADIRLGHNKLTQIQHTDFLNVTELQLLALNDNQLSFIGDGAFTHLEKLQELWLRSNQLVYIPRDLPDNLRKLHMDYNKLQNIEVGLFGPNSRLDYLTVENNQLVSVAARTFNSLRFLVRLNFQGNRIQRLEERAFSNLNRLQDLLLSNNPLNRIDNDAFFQLSNLNSLQLSHLAEENFTLTTSFLPQMRRISSLGMMASPGLAQALMDLIANPRATPVVMTTMQAVDMSYNTLEWISPRVRELFPNLRRFALDGNPLRCTRSLKWLSDWMREDATVSFYNYEEPLCEKPYRLRGITLRNVQDNQWAEEDEEDGYPQYGSRRSLRELQSDSTGVYARREPAQPIITGISKFMATNRKAAAKKRNDKKRKTKDRLRKRNGKGKKNKKAKGKKVNKKRNKDIRRRKDRRGKGKRRKRDVEEEMNNILANDEGIQVVSV